MDKIMNLISLRQLLVLSVAINFGLIWKFVFEGDTNSQTRHGFRFEKQSKSLMEEGSGKEAHDSNRSPPYASSVASSTAAVRTELEDGGERVINLDHGDPTMYEKFWRTKGEETSIVISGWQMLSYFSDVHNLCWFLEPEFARQIVRLHRAVGNAVTENRFIVVGTGSTQLYQAALFALSPSDAAEPISVVSAAPFYSSYPLMTDYLKSGLHKWAGDARSFNKDGPYIELVTSPNNPDGLTRKSVVNRSQGILIHDFAYYWPQYTPITSAADHDLMLFTVSKSTGHAGMRIGWALVKDTEIAKKMTKFIELNTIGVSKDSQLRAAKVLEAVSNSCELVGNHEEGETFFEFGYRMMAERWGQLREAVKQGDVFSLPDFPSGLCSFSGLEFELQPAFAWLKCEEEIEDCEAFLRGHKILTRSGKHFGVSPKFVRISMLDRDDNYNQFVKRLSAISAAQSSGRNAYQ